MRVDKKQKATRNISNAVLALFFLAVVFLPSLSKIVPLESRLKLPEQRTPADRPKLQWKFPALLRYPGSFDLYAKSNFGFRSTLVRQFGRIRSRVPGLIVGNKVLVGKDGWYFIAEDRTLDDFLGIIRLSPSKLDQIKSVLEERREWLAMFGIKYLLAIATAKWEVYPENVPLNRGRVSGRTVLDQIAAYLKDNDGIDLLDLREPLRSLKNTQPVYSRTDTHWNNIGFFVAVQEIKKRLSMWFPGISADTLENFEIQEEKRYSGDLARMMGLGGKIPQIEYTLVGNDGKELPPRTSVLENSMGRTWTFEEPVGFPGKPRAAIFHDSFGSSFPFYLRDAFLRSAYSWRSTLDTRLIILEHPDVVIQELAERRITETLSKNPPGIVGPHSILTGKNGQFHCPDTFRLTDFTARALSGLPVRQHIALSCNGEEILEWPLEEEERRYAVPQHRRPPGQKILIYSFAYRYDPSLPSSGDGRRAVPFDLQAECGASRCFIAINGREFTGLRGHNIYWIGLNGRLSQAQNFNDVSPGGKGREMARFIERVKRKKGFLLLIDQRRSNRSLSQEAQKVLFSVGLKAYARNRRDLNSISLIDLGSKRVIAERSGPAPQRLTVGNYRTDAGFRVRSLRVAKDTD
jgi:hypothetical protein